MNEMFRKEYDFTCYSGKLLYSDEQGFGFVTEVNRGEVTRLKIPELNGGFLPKWWYGDEKLTEIEITGEGCAWRPSSRVRQEDLEGRAVPLCFKADVPRQGCYRLTLELYGAGEDEEVLLFTGRRRLAWRGVIPSGEKVAVHAMCDVFPIIPRGRTNAVCDCSVLFSLVCFGDGLRLRRVKVEEKSVHTVFIMGDSTVTDQTGDYPYAPGSSYGGWGQMLGAFIPEGYCVSNHAHSGLTTESFRSEGHWDVMKPLIRPGDYCLMQFGHNDQKFSNLRAEGGYTARLDAYISEIQGKKAIPVLVTPVARNSWKNPEQYNDMLEEYAEAVVRLGKRRNILTVDLHGYAMEFIKKDGLDGAKRWFFPSDYTHFNDYGAYKAAAFVAEKFCTGVHLAQNVLSEWTPGEPFNLLEPPENCAVIPPDKNSDFLDTFAAERPSEPITRIECLELVKERLHFFPVNVYNDLYDDVLGHETYAGIVQCAAQNDMIPDALTADGKLHPHNTMTLQEFLSVLMPAWARRKKLCRSEKIPENVDDFAKEAVSQALGEGVAEYHSDWHALVSREQAVKLCRAVRI